VGSKDKLCFGDLFPSKAEIRWWEQLIFGAEKCCSVVLPPKDPRKYDSSADKLQQCTKLAVSNQLVGMKRMAKRW